MISKEFMNRVANGKDDFLQSFIDIVNEQKIPFCVIGGLGVNAYAEPVVSLDLDVVVIIGKLDKLISVLKKRFTINKHLNSVNISEKESEQAGSEEIHTSLLVEGIEYNLKTDKAKSKIVGPSVLQMNLR